ncbi:DUF1403 family protein [Methylocystis sp. IM3]|uniref:DUF1403 family protein n=1 Tax=unclassified Methylocystis TaxID=2625913 RepID=UPI00311A3A8F
MSSLDSTAAPTGAPTSAPAPTSSAFVPTAPTPARRRGHARRAAAAPAELAEPQPFPQWARVPDAGDGAAAFFAGAGLARFDAVLRGAAAGAEPPFAGVLRQRLALSAAAACAGFARLREDAGALRDAEHLAAAEGGATSPAGRLHRLFRLCAARPAGLDAQTLARAGALLGPLFDADAAAAALRESVAAAPDPLAAAARASAAAPALCAAGGGVEAEIFALFVADLALAARLGWARPVPLLAVAVAQASPRRGPIARRPRPADADWPEAVARAYGLAAAQAHARAADLARRADRLLRVAPGLRARGAGRVVEMLLADDGATPLAAARASGMSDRAARRLFDRLVALGAARELTGRAAFRIYGL